MRDRATRGDDGPVWTDGWLVVVAESLLWKVPVDAAGRITGKPVRLSDEVTDSVHSNFFKHLPSLLTGAPQVSFTEFHAPTARWFSVRAHTSGGRIAVLLRDVTAEHESGAREHG